VKDIDKFISPIFSLMQKDKVFRWLFVEIILKYAGDLGFLHASKAVQKAIQDSQSGGDFWESLTFSFGAQAGGLEFEIQKQPIEIAGNTFELGYSDLLRLGWFILNLVDILDWNVVLKALDVLSKALPSSKI